MTLKANTKRDIINLDEARKQRIMSMKKEAYVIERHKYTIAPGRGADTRYFTNVYTTDADGKRHKKKMAAQTYEGLIAKLYDFYQSEEQAARQADTLKSVYESWLAVQYSICTKSSTVKRYDDYWRKYYAGDEISRDFINLPMSEIRPQDVEEWGRRLIKKYNMDKKAFVNAITPARKMLDTMYRKAENPARVAEFPATLFVVKQRKAAEEAVFFPDEIAAMMAQCRTKAEKTGDETWLVFPLLYATGCRLGEVLALSFQDVDLENRTLNVHATYATDNVLNADGTWTQRYIYREGLKRNAPGRVIHLVPAAVDIIVSIQSLLAQKGECRQHLFSVNSPTAVRSRLYSLCDSQSAKRRGTHAFRRTLISQLLDSQAVSQDYIREMVGHSNLRTTLNAYAFSSRRENENDAALDAVIG